MIVADLFLEQSVPWEAIIRTHIDRVWKAARDFLSLAAIYIADAATSKVLFQKIFEPALNQLLGSLNVKTAELLTPHQRSHPITDNHYFTETLQKVRNERSENEYSRIVKNFFEISTLEPVFYTNQHKDLRQLVTALVQSTEPDMNRFACSEALDCMEAYYKVALRRFTDDIAIEAVEAKLLSPLGDVFSPVAVSAMPAELITRIAGESEENRAQREQLTKQLDVLMKDSDTCKRFIGVKLLNPDDGTIQLDPKTNSTSKNSSDFDVAPDDSSQEDVKSLSDRSVSYRSSPLEEVSEFVSTGFKESREEAPIPLADLVEEPKEERLYSSKKKFKNPKLSAKRAPFEED
ncbi:hypothetical protein N7G274_000492 [Stereocaulon virgatum]|uniref:GED domain-containing protein n=1 Tax=Stereocaulon virgatum TaxID=373712 RepID=A0ABR4ASZ7_9LECA